MVAENKDPTFLRPALVVQPHSTPLRNQCRALNEGKVKRRQHSWGEREKRMATGLSCFYLFCRAFLSLPAINVKQRTRRNEQTLGLNFPASCIYNMYIPIYIHIILPNIV